MTLECILLALSSLETDSLDFSTLLVEKFSTLSGNMLFLSLRSWGEGISLRASLHQVVDDVFPMDELVQANRPRHSLDVLQMEPGVSDHFEERKTDECWPS